MYQIFLEKIYICQFGVTYGLEEANDNVIYKLNTMTDTLNEMAKNYKETGKETDAKKAFIENLNEELEKIQENVLYEDLSNEDNGLSLEIFEFLEENEEIKKDDIIKILENRNEYILGFEDFDTNMKIEEDLNKVSLIINNIYKIGQVNNIWKKRLKENKKVISNQLRRCI